MTKRPRQDSLEDQIPFTTTPTLPKRQRRTPRACDRCRLKRIKCDGMAQCQPCVKSDNPCLYTHQRNSASKNYHWQMRDVMNEALRRMYIACKNRSGFPGEMPASNGNHDDQVSVQAILEGLGLIPSPGGESPPYNNFDPSHSVWRIPDISESSTPSQNTEDMVPRMVNEHIHTCLRPQSRTSHEQVVPSPAIGLAVRQDEYHWATTKLSPHQTNRYTSHLSYPINFAQPVTLAPQNHQISFHQGWSDGAAPSWLGSNATPPLASYDLSYAY